MKGQPGPGTARPETSGHAADRVVPDCRGAGILVRRAHRTGPSFLTVKLVAGHGAGARGSSGRDALMPQGSRTDSGTAGLSAGCPETAGAHIGSVLGGEVAVLICCIARRLS